MKHITGIIVTYEPDLKVLDKLILSIRNQLDSLIIIDNGSYLQPDLDKYDCRKIFNRFNAGLATAQNQGINFAINNGATHVLIFDQDSEPEADMVGNLYFSELQLLTTGHLLAAVGPNCVDRRTKAPNPFYALKGWRYQKKFSPDFDGVVEAAFLISSGLLIRVDVLKHVGMMREDLFIDYIDIEWGLRAAQKGYRSFGVLNARMFHSVGDADIMKHGKRLPVHSPARCYYMTRNALRLYLSSKFPVRWMIADSIVFIQRILVASMFFHPRREYIKNIALALMHGVSGRMGNKMQWLE